MRKNKKQKITKITPPIKSGVSVWQGIGLGIAVLFFLMIPPSDYYQTLTLEYYPPAVRNTNYDNFQPSRYPVKTTNAVPPIVTASAAAVIDLESGIPIFQKSVNLRLKPASITKLMTALVALDYYHPEDIVTVNSLVITAGDSKMGLKLGDQLTVRNLLYGLLLPSGNDAAYVLANNIPGGFEQFITSMNLKSQSLHMYSTHFVNPTGRDADNHYTNIYDLIILTREAIRNPIIADIVKTNWVQVYDIFGARRFPLQNVNDLLSSYGGTYGVKTGFTELAGQCLIAAAQKGNRKILAVVLNSQDRFTETKNLLNFGFNNFTLTGQNELH